VFIRQRTAERRNERRQYKTTMPRRNDMRTTTRTSPKLRVRREALRQLTAADLQVVAGGTSGHIVCMA
jgi:hypothetical protein